MGYDAFMALVVKSAMLYRKRLNGDPFNLLHPPDRPRPGAGWAEVVPDHLPHLSWYLACPPFPVRGVSVNDLTNRLGQIYLSQEPVVCATLSVPQQ